MAPAAQADPEPRARTTARASAPALRARPVTRSKLMSGFLVVVAGVAWHEDIAVAVGRHLRNEPGLFHLLEQAGGPVVADAQVALDEGDRGPAALQDHGDRLVVHRVGFALDAGFAQRLGQAAETDRAARVGLLGNAA